MDKQLNKLIITGLMHLEKKFNTNAVEKYMRILKDSGIERSEPKEDIPYKKYNLLFKMAEEDYGYSELEKMWETMALTLNELNTLVSKKQIDGCLEYWKPKVEKWKDATIRQAPNSKMIVMTIPECPAMKAIDNPSQVYCKHCEVMYNKILRPYNIRFRTLKLNKDNKGCLTVIEQKKGTK